jgi:VCBS repeat-containing protein
MPTIDNPGVNDAPTILFGALPMVPVGPEFRANSVIPLDQNQSSVAALASGGFVLCWRARNGDGSFSGIKAQIFDPFGSKVGGEFLVNTATLVDQIQPAVIGLAGGGFIVTWADGSTEGGDTFLLGVKAQIFSSTGAKIGAEFLVNTQTAGSQSLPAIGALPSGGFLVSWADGGSGDIKAQLYDPAGGRVGGEFLVNSQTANVQSQPAATALSSGGFVISWTDSSSAGGDSSGTAVKAQLFDSTGAKIGSEFLVNSSLTGDQSAPSLTGLASGGFVAAWVDQNGDGSSDGIKAQIFDSSGARVGIELLVNSLTLNAQTEVSVAALASGGFVVSWRDSSGLNGDASGSAIRAQRFDASGVRVGPEFLVNGATLNDQFDPSVAGLATGGFVVSWTDSSGQGGDSDGSAIKAQLFAPVALEQALCDLKGVIRIDDADSGGATLTVTLSVDYGVLEVAAGGSGAIVTGSGTATVTVEGTLIQIQAFLATDPASGVAFAASGDSPPISALLQVRVNDNGGNGIDPGLSGDETSEEAVASLPILIAPLNDAPTGASSTIALVEEGVHVFAAAEFGFDDVEGDSFAGLVVTTLPAKGTLLLNGTAIAAGASIALADIEAGHFTYAPAANGAGPGYSSFTFQLRDDGGTDRGGLDLDPTPDRISFDVIAVNDAPTVAVSPTHWKVGPELLVNSDSLNSDFDSAIAALASDRFAVTWSRATFLDGVPGIVAQVFDSSGTKIGVDFTVASGSGVSTPTVGALTSGHYVIAWRTFDSSGSGIVAQIFGASGAIGPAFTVNSSTASDQTDPSVSGLGSGGFVVTWMDRSGSGGDSSAAAIKAQLFDASGARVGGELLVNTNTAGSQELSTVTGLASGGFVVTWKDETGDSSGTSIKAQIFDAAGAKVGSEFLVNLVPWEDQHDPVVAALPSGGFIITWSHWSSFGGDSGGSSIKAQIFNASGTKIDWDFIANTTGPANQHQPAVAVLPSGRFVIAWTDESGQGGDPSGTSIKAQLFEANGAKIGGEFLVATSTAANQYQPEIAILPSGRIMISWTDESGNVDPTPPAIKAQVLAIPEAVEQVPFSLKGAFSVGDVDAGSGIVRVTLSTDYGQLVATAGTSGTTISGSGSNSVTIMGTLAQVQNLLGSTTRGSIAFIANGDDPPASARIGITINDRGNGGADPGITGDATSEEAGAALILSILPVNDPPSAADITLNVGRNSTHVFTLADFGFSDPDGDALSRVAIYDMASDGKLMVDVDGPGGSEPVTVQPFGPDSPAMITREVIEAGGLYFFPEAGEGGVRYSSFRFAVESNGDSPSLSTRHIFTINVDDAPLLQNLAADTASFTEGGPAVRLDSGAAAMVIDSDNVHMDGGRLIVSITGNEVAAEDVLGIGGGGTIALSNGTNVGSIVSVGGLAIGTVSSDGRGGSDLVIQFDTDDSSPARISSLVQALTYFNSDSANPTPQKRSVTVTIEDSIGGSDTHTMFVDVATVNDSPRALIAAPDLAPAGGGILVSTTTAGEQNLSSVAGMEDGSYVLVWSSVDGASERVFRQLYGADGSAIGGETMIGTTSSALQSRPVVAALEGGGHVIAWTGDGNGLFAQRFDSSGTAVGDEIVVMASGSFSARPAAVAALADGGFAITWDSSSPGDIFARIFDASGAPRTDVFQVNGGSTEDQADPSIAPTPDGGFRIAWSDKLDRYDVRSQLFDAHGTRIGSQALESPNSLAGHHEQSASALVGETNVIVWSNRGSAVFQNLYNAESNGATIRVAPVSSSAGRQPAVSGLADGTYVVVWDFAGDGRDLFAARFDRDGTLLESGLVHGSTAGDQAFASIAGLARGGYVAAWTSGGDIHAQRYDDCFHAVEQVPLDLKRTMKIADVDAGTAAMTVSLSVDYGILTVTAGASGAAVSGSGTSSVTITGTLAEINFLLGDDPASIVTFTADTEAPPALATLTLTVDDGAGGTAVDTETIHIAAINDAPVNQLPGTLAGFEDEPIFFAGGLFIDPPPVIVGDVDSAAISVRLSVADGRLSPLSSGAAIVTGNHSNDITISGTAADVNLAVYTMRYTPEPDANGPRTIIVTTSDGTLSDVDTIAVDIRAINDAPSGADFARTAAAGSTYQIQLGDFGFSDLSDGHALLGVVLASTPAFGRLINTNGFEDDGIDIDGDGRPDLVVRKFVYDVGDTISAADLLAGYVHYEADPGVSGADSFDFLVRDDGGTAFGGIDLDSGANTLTFDVIPPAIANDDVDEVSEDSLIVGASLIGNDVPTAGLDLGIEEVNGAAANVGIEILLASGAKLTVNADGTYDYDPNGRFGALVSSATALATGAVNDSATDSFTYKLANGGTATVTITINGVASTQDRLEGDGGDNVVTGTPNVDIFLLAQGGDDWVAGLDSNDVFYFGGAYGNADIVDGGSGVDIVALQGDYGTGLTLGSLTGIESVSLLSGSNTLFGDLAGNRYDFDITTVESNVAAGAVLKVNGGNLLAGEDLTFDGSDETDGHILIYGGKGVDLLTGGAGNDVFFFAHDGRLGAGDHVDGGAGIDGLFLRGSFTIDFNDPAYADLIRNVENFTLTSVTDIRYARSADTEFDYDLITDDELVGAGLTVTFNGGLLQANETIILDAHHETDGHLRIFAGASDDTVIGGAGNDLIYGGLGEDSLTGGAGNDVFQYNAVAESGPAAADSILDFAAGDRIDLSRIDAKSGATASDSFTFIGGAAFTNIQGQLRVEDMGGGIWQVQGDVDGDGLADLALMLVVIDSDPITAGDFFL